jgi:DNA-directed RNA polymerase specialized sigma24 family protein
MSVAYPYRQPSGSASAATIFENLEREWIHASGQPEMKARSRAWAAAEPTLEGCSDSDGVLHLVTWEGRRPSDQGSRVLSAMLRQATDPLAARTLLQALLPRIKTEKVITPKYGHGVSETWQRPWDTVADLVAECFAAVKRHAGEDVDDVPRLVLREATRKLRTARQAQRRYHDRTVILVSDHPTYAAADLSVARSGAEWLAAALTEAVRSRHLSKTDARLVYATRVKGLPASEVGRYAGMPPKAVYYALARAERTLRRRAA